MFLLLETAWSTATRWMKMVDKEEDEVEDGRKRK